MSLNSLPSEIRDVLKSVVGTPNDFHPIGGGCINHGGKLVTTSGNYFLKWNSSARYPGMFAREAQGLRLLSQAGVIRVPEVIGVCEAGGVQCLLLEFVKTGRQTGKYWNLLGEQVAQLHEVRAAMHGLDENNYIGSLQQSNKRHGTWTTFFIEERLKPQIALATASGHFLERDLDHFLKLFEQIPNMVEEPSASLLHGDLWSGNVMADEHDMPCLIDPAVYYGNREMDIAFAKLFGGFSAAFFEAYDRCFPLPKGFEQRVTLWNLYPLLVHVNLFGGGYVDQTRSALRHYI